MTDFITAFQMGQKAAEEAEKARKQVDAVFQELNNQVRQTTDGRISIFRDLIEERISPIERAQLAASFERSKWYWAIVANNPKAKSPWKELARWHQDKQGFPCKIEWAGKQMFCEDKESLSSCLAELISDVGVGMILYALMRLPDAELKDAAAKDSASEKKK